MFPPPLESIQIYSVLYLLPPVEPKIIMPDVVSERAGAKLRVEAVISGKPSPTCKWIRGDVPLVSSSRLAMHHSGNLCVLIIKDVSRTDSGDYSLVAENSSAKAVQGLKIVIRGQCPCLIFFVGILSKSQTAWLDRVNLCLM